MNKIEPLDMDTEYNDTHDASMSEPMHEKDECSDENGNFDDMDRDPADTKMHLAGLGDIKADHSENDDAADGKSQAYGSRERDDGDDRCLESHETNLLGRTAIDQIDTKPGEGLFCLRCTLVGAGFLFLCALMNVSFS